MALTGWGVGAYLDRAAAVGNYPVGMSAFGHVASYAAIDEYTGVSIGIAGSSGNRRAVLTQTGALSGVGNRVRALVRTTTNSFAAAASDSPAGSWYHLWGAFPSTSLREALLDGGNKGTEATTRDPSAPNSTRIGVRPDLQDPWGATDGLAEVSFWNLTGFTATDRDNLAIKLAAGEVPTDIDAEVGQPWSGMLLCYVLDSTNSLTDLSGNGNNFTMVGTLTDFGSHPPVGGGGGNTAPNTPTCSVASETDTTVSLTSSAFSDPDVGDTHAASQWQVDESGGDFSSPVADSGETAVNLTSRTLTGLTASTAYIARVRHKDDSADAGTEWSAWSTSAAFTTDATPGAPTVGPRIRTFGFGAL